MGVATERRQTQAETQSKQRDEDNGNVDDDKCSIIWMILLAQIQTSTYQNRSTQWPRTTFQTKQSPAMLAHHPLCRSLRPATIITVLDVLETLRRTAQVRALTHGLHRPHLNARRWHAQASCFVQQARVHNQETCTVCQQGLHRVIWRRCNARR